MSKMLKRIMATFLVLLMAVSMLSTFSVVAHGETVTDNEQLLADAYIINQGWSRESLAGSGNLTLFFRGSYYTVNPATHKLFCTFEDAYEAAYGNADVTANNYFDFVPTFVFGPGDYTNEMIHIPTNANIFGANAGISPNAPLDTSERTIDYFTKNGGWPQNPDYNSTNKTKLGTVVFTTRDKGTSGSWDAMPSEGEATKWHYIRNKAYQLNPEAELECVIDGVELGGRVNLSAYDEAVVFTYNGETVEKSVSGRQTNVRIKNSTTSLSSNLISSWNTTWHYQNFFFESCRFDKNISDFGTRYVDDLTFTDCYFASFSTESALFTTWIGESGVRYDSADLTVDGCVFYNCTGMTFHINSNNFPDSVTNINFTLENSVLYNAGTATWGIFRLTNNENRNLTVNVQDNLIYHTSNTNTLFNGNASYVTNGKNTIRFNGNRVVSATLGSLLPNMGGYSIFDKVDGSGNTVYGTNTLFDIDFSDNFFAASETEQGQTVAYHSNSCPVGNAEDSVWDWSWTDPSYYFDFACDYLNHGARVTGVDGGAVVAKGNDVSIYVGSSGTITADSFAFRDADSKINAVISTKNDFSSTVSSIDLTKIKSGDVYYLKSAYADEKYAASTEQITKITFYISDADSFNQALAAGQIKVGDKVLSPDNTVVVASTNADILSTADGDFFFSWFAGKKYKFDIDNKFVFPNVTKTYSYTTVDGAVKAHNALDVDIFRDKCENGNIILVGGNTNARLVPTYPVTFYGANAGVDPVERNGLTASLSSQWNTDYATKTVNTIVMAYDIDGKVVFDGLTLSGKYWDDVRYSKEGTLDVTFENIVIDSSEQSNAFFYLGSPRAMNGSQNTFADVEFGKINNDSFTVKNCYVSRIGDNQLIHEDVCPNVTIDNLHVDNVASGKRRNLIAFFKIGLYNKNSNITVKNSSFINSANNIYPLLQYQGFRNNPEVLIDDSYDININFTDNIVYNTGAVAAGIFYLASGQLSSLKITGNTFVSTDNARIFMKDIEEWSSSANCQLAGNITISDNSFVGFDAETLACDLNMANNNPKLINCFISSDASALTRPRDFIGQQIEGITYGDVYLNFERSALLSDYSIKSVTVAGGRATFDNTTATVDIEHSSGGEVVFINRNSDAVGKLSGDASKPGTYTYTITLNGMSRDYTVNVTASDYSDYTLISNAQQFDDIRKNPSGKYLLTDDITLDDGFTPISNFSGILDGGFHSVKGINFVINSSSNVTAALFESCSGTVKNLSVYGNIKVSTTASAYVGGIVGTGNATVIDCYNHCNITVNAKAAYVGGIASAASEISGCYNAGDISVTASGYSISAGIAADALSVSRCYNAATITSTGDACGISAYGNVNDCYNAGVVTSDDFASGISFDDNIKNCYNVAFINGGSESYGITQNGYVVNSYYAKYLAGGNGTVLERDMLGDAASYIGFDFGGTWQMSDDDEYPLPVLVGVPNVATAGTGKNNGSPFDPFLITNKEQFEAIRNYNGGYFKLENNIDLGDFTPVETFSGYFDGNGKTVTVNLTSNDKYVGVFGKNSGTIISLGVKGSITSTAKDAYVGGICGENTGVITACYNNADISAAAGSYVGGIAGKGKDITLCHNTASVNGGAAAGGIVGYGFAVNSYNIGDVEAIGYAGGISGLGGAEDCYSLGKVNGKNAGGIVGGYDDGLTVINCYFFDSAASNGYGTACAPSAFYEQSTYAGFDFGDVWKMSTDSAYPFAVHVKVNNTAKYTDESCGFAGGNGSVFAPFIIETAAQLDNIRNYPKSYFMLACDITMGDNSFAPIDNFEGMLDGNGKTIKNLKINTTANGALFVVNSGTVKNLGISGCVVTVSGDSRVTGAPLAAKNLGTISNCYTEGTVNVNSTVPAFASGFVGENGGSIENCYSAVTVNSNYYAAGFATYNDGDIASCYSVSTLGSAQNLGIGGFVIASSGSVKGGFSIIAKNTGGIDTEKSLSEMMMKSTYSTFDFVNTWTMSNDAKYPFPVLNSLPCDINITNNVNTVQFGGGNGSAVNPYVVANADHLANVCEYPDAYFVQTADIDLGGIEYTPVAEFYGVYDGAGKKISNLKIASQDGTVGLFAQNYGVISGISLENAVINVKSADELAYIGGIVGINYSGRISACKVSADIKAKTAYNAYVGGIVGHNYGKEASGCEFDGTVEVTAVGTAYVGGIAGYSKSAVSGKSSGAVASSGAKTNYLGGLVGLCDGTVSGENRAVVYSKDGGGYIGGVVGKNADNYAQITSTGMVNHGAVLSLDSASIVFVGGVVGYTTENINKAYNTGAVSAASDKSVVGGIAGISDGVITNTFNSASLSGAVVGGLVGQNTGSVLTSYSLTGGIGDNHGAYTSCLFGNSCTTSQNAYAGFDFSNTWTMSGNTSYAYPELKGYDVVNTASKITVDSFKTEYQYNDYTKENATITVTYKLGGNETVTTDRYSIIGFDSCQIGAQDVAVAYGGAYVIKTVKVLCPHKYSGDCDDECDLCHEKREAASHSYQLSYDEQNHFYKCKNCEDTFGETAHKFDNDCDTTCSGCKYVRVTAHDYQAEYDQVSHFNKCTICGDITQSEAHDFDNECDTNCNGCDYTRTTQHSYQLSYDEQNHFYKCKNCEDTFGETAHKFDDNCDTTCSGCKYVRVAPHEWGNYVYNKDATTEADGTKTRECTVCHEKETVTAEGTKLPSEPGVTPDNRLPQVVLNSSGNGVVTDMRGSWATRVYWGCIGDENVEYKWFDDDFRLLCGTDYFADYAPRADKSYYFTKPGYYRFVLKCIISGTDASNYKYKDVVYTFYFDGNNVQVPSIEMVDGNHVKLNTNGLTVKKMYYGNIGDVNTPYSWFNAFWDASLKSKSYKAVYGPRDSSSYVLSTKGYYNFVICFDDATGKYQELAYTVYAEDNIDIIKDKNGKATVNLTNIGGTVSKLYYGYVGTEAKTITNYDEFVAAVADRTGDWDVKNGESYTFTQKGYYAFCVNYTTKCLINGNENTPVTYDIIYIIENK